MTDHPDDSAASPEQVPAADSAAVEAVEQPEGPSAGQLLRDGRAALDMSLQQLAAQTRIKPNILELLEKDEDPEDQAPVFVRGHYRRCAKVLGIAEADMVRAYEQRVGGMPPPQAEPVEWVSVVRQPSRVPFPGGGWALLTAIATFIIIVVGVALLRESNGAAAVNPPKAQQSTAQTHAQAQAQAQVQVQARPRQRQDTHKPAAAEAAAEPAQAQVAAALQPAAALPEPSDSVTARAITQATAPAPATQGAGADAPSSAATAGPTTLVLRAGENCWTSVHDASGKRLMQGIIPAGHKRELQGQPPFTVVLGNARGMAVTYAGRAVDISGKVSADSNTARFTIPLRKD